MTARIRIVQDDRDPEPLPFAPEVERHWTAADWVWRLRALAVGAGVVAFTWFCASLLGALFGGR